MTDNNKLSGTGNEIITRPARLYGKEMDGVNSTDTNNDGASANVAKDEATLESKIDTDDKSARSNRDDSDR
jgi:hypothetical protein